MVDSANGQTDGGPTSRTAHGPSPSSESGMTLIEILVAVFVLTVGLLAVAAMTGAVATQTRTAGSLTGQAAAGQQVLEALRMQGYASLTPGTQGTRQVTVNSHSYTVTYAIASGGTGLKEIEVRIDGTRDLPPDTMSTLLHER